MFAKTLLVLVVAAGCTKAGPPNETPPAPDKGKPGVAMPDPTPTPTPTAAAATTVTLAAVTFADDCGGEPPWNPPAPAAASPSAPAASAAKRAPGSSATMAGQASGGASAKRRCQQTSMQLDVIAGADTDVKIKSVEVSDETGKLLGTLATSMPRRWSEKASVYEAWDGKVKKGEAAQVTYVLERPPFVSYDESFTRTYSVKVVAVVGGVEETKTTSVMMVGRPSPVST